MSERYRSPKQSAMRRFWAAGFLGGSLMLSTHLIGEHYINEHHGEPVVDAQGAPSEERQLESFFGGVEIVEAVAAIGALGLYGKRTLQAGALPRVRTAAYRLQHSKICKALTPTDITLAEAQSSQPVEEPVLVGNIRQLGDAVILHGLGGVEEVAQLMDWGTRADSTDRDIHVIAEGLRSRLDN